VAASEPYSNLLRLHCTIRNRIDSVDAHGDVVTTEDIVGPLPCHAYQRYREEYIDGRMLGMEEIVVHLLVDTPVNVGSRLDIEWPDHRTVEAEVVGPPARRVRARTGRVHHIELRAREIH